MNIAKKDILPLPAYAPAQSTLLSNSSKKSYGQILKSSAVLGSSSAVIAIVGLLRNKAITTMLGTSGAGLWGLLWSISELSRSIAGIGINNSGVRQIAEAVGTGDNQRIARTVLTLRRVSLALGLLGAALLCALCVPVAKIWFQDYTYAGTVALISLTVLFATISQGQTALIQGMRRVGDFARNSVLGAVLGTIFSIPIVYFFGARGVAPALVCVSFLGVLTSWWYARKIKVEPIQLSTSEVVTEASSLLRLGFIFMLSGVMLQGVMALVNIILMHKLDEHAVGLYLQAWLMSGYVVGFILQAMGTDYYPRLTIAAKNNVECNRLVNEQAEVGLLLAGPGLLATLTFAPLALHIISSAKFLPATDVLRWFCIGMLLRVFSWPVAFVMLAKNAQRLFICSELFSNALYIALVWLFVGMFGLKGVGIAFALFYAVYTCLVYVLVRRLSGFRWSRENLVIAFTYGLLAAGVFAACEFLNPTLATVIGVVTMTATGIFSLKKLCALIPAERFPRRARQLLVWLRMLPASASA